MPTYEYQCVECGPFTQWRSIHAGPLESCPECGNTVAKVISIPALHGIGNRGAETRRVDGTEKQWSKDMRAYRQLRMEGHQPRGIDGCDRLAANALGDWEIRTGQHYPDDVVNTAQERAREIMSGRL